MTRVHKCAYIAPDGTACPQLEPCPVHGRRAQKRNGWHHRDGDRAAHMRWRRKAIRAQGSCQMCGSTEKLDVHHDAAGQPVVLCNLHHVAIDPHARAR